MKSNSLRNRRRPKSLRRANLSLNRRGRSCRTVAFEYLESRQLLAVGDLDVTFGNGGKAVFPFSLGGNNSDDAYAVAVDSKNRVIAVGPVQRNNTGNNDFGIVRFNPNGTPDKTFGPNHDGSVVLSGDFGGTDDDTPTSVAIDASDRIVVAGYAEIDPGFYDFGLLRLDENGNLDTSFGGDGAAPKGKVGIAFNNVPGDTDDRASGVAITSSGKIIVVGTVMDSSGSKQFGIAGLDANGHLDPTFGNHGTQTVSYGDADEGATAVALGDGGNTIVVAGYTVHAGKSAFAVVDLVSNGQLNPAFVNGGKSYMPFSLGDAKATSVAVDQQGRILAAGTVVDGDHESVAMARISMDGKTFDGSLNGSGEQAFDFGTAQYNAATNVLVDQGGRLVVSGFTLDPLSGSGSFAVARLKDDGSFDTTFSGDGRTTFNFNAGGKFDGALGAALDKNGQLVVAGAAERDDLGASDFAVARLVANRAPIAVNDVFVLSQSPTSSLTAATGALANDYDPDGDPILGASVGVAAHGVLVGNPDGSSSYTPDASFKGYDRVSYTITDGAAESNTATVTLLSQHAAVVWKFYESVLNREPDDQGLQYWTNYFDNGGKTGDMAFGFFESDELLNRIIADYYQQFLLRTLDDDGLAYWKGVWHATGGPEQIKAGFAASPEFYTSAGGTPDNWIDALYHRILNRAPDTEGRQYWLNYYHQQVDGGGAAGQAKSQIALGFFDSREAFRNDVAGWFHEYLFRDPTASESDHYVAEMQAGGSDRQIEQEITNLPEYGENPPLPADGTAVALPSYSTGTSSPASTAAKDALFARLG